MNEPGFMVNFLGQSFDLRLKCWVLFNQSLPEARWFASQHHNWIEITSIEHHPTVAVWEENGKITFPAHEGNLSALFHEMFHSAFHKSPLWSSNGNWGDSFCDIFRWFMEARLLGGSTDSFIDRDKCLKILTKCNRNYNEFKSLWVDLNQRQGVVLDDYFR